MISRLNLAGLKDLEERIVDFTLGGADVLVATTIMENGIDIPNVNTIIIQARCRRDSAEIAPRYRGERHRHIKRQHHHHPGEMVPR